MRGGERFRPAGSAHRRSLKNLFQERGVAPWVRTRTPLLEHEDRLVFVGGVGAGSAWPQDLGFGGSELCWRHALAGVAGVQHL
jgi:tRNA(Ile)-lysidine synthase